MCKNMPSILLNPNSWSFYGFDCLAGLSCKKTIPGVEARVREYVSNTLMTDNVPTIGACIFSEDCRNICPHGCKSYECNINNGTCECDKCE